MRTDRTSCGLRRELPLPKVELLLSLEGTSGQGCGFGEFRRGLLVGPWRRGYGDSSTVHPQLFREPLPRTVHRGGFAREPDDRRLLGTLRSIAR